MDRDKGFFKHLWNRGSSSLLHLSSHFCILHVFLGWLTWPLGTDRRLRWRPRDWEQLSFKQRGLLNHERDHTDRESRDLKNRWDIQQNTFLIETHKWLLLPFSGSCPNWPNSQSSELLSTLHHSVCFNSSSCHPVLLQTWFDFTWLITYWKVFVLHQAARFCIDWIILFYRLQPWRISWPRRCVSANNTFPEVYALGMRSKTSVTFWMAHWATSYRIHLWTPSFWSQNPRSWMPPWISIPVFSPLSWPQLVAIHPL